MATLTITTLPIADFTWNREGSTLCAFASDFGSLAEGTFWLQPLYDDACDLGIAIYSKRTQRTERFYFVPELGVGANGERNAFIFHPVDRNSRVKTVAIFND